MKNARQTSPHAPVALRDDPEAQLRHELDRLLLIARSRPYHTAQGLMTIPIVRDSRE